MLPISQLKVKVTVKGQILNKQILDIMSCPLYKPYTNGRIPSNLNDTFASTRGCAEPMLSVCQLKVKVTVKCQIFNKQILHIMSRPLYNSFTNGRIFFLTWMTHSPQLGDVQSPCCPCVSSRSRSQLNVKILNKQILDIMSCPLYKPYTNGRISLDVQKKRSNIKQTNIRHYVMSAL